MIQEYLFMTKEHKAEMEHLVVPDEIQKEIKTIENSSCWTLCLSVDSESKEAAKLLDSFNEQIYEKYKPTVLSNGCSAYFNKLLFPIINEFERKLRKLLYLASALQGDENTHKVIIDLESKDLGKIFETLFCDVNFVKCVREKVNQKTWQFTRNELLAIIKNLDENTLWDTLLGCDCVKTLRKRFGELRIYRNDVMHAHNINLTQYRSAKRLFQKVNEELDVAIGKMIGAKEENESVTPADFNSALSSALSSIQDPITEPLYKDMFESIYKDALAYASAHTHEFAHIVKEYEDKLDQIYKSDLLIAKSDLLSKSIKQVKEYVSKKPSKIMKMEHKLLETGTGTLQESDNLTIGNKEKNKSNGQAENGNP